MTSSPSLFVFGVGFTALALARLLQAEGGWRIAGTRRPPVGEAPGIPLHPFDGEAPLDPALFHGVTHVLASIPPGPDGDPALRIHGAHLAALPRLRWVGYLSTTGVYGDTAGAWVDEESPTAPTQPRSARRVLAEAAWGDPALGLPAHVFRLAGIYGPGRSPLDRARAGDARRIDLPGHVSSRIHVDDAARALRASMDRPRPGAVYNVADDEPAPPEAVTAWACARLGLPIPPLVPLAEAGLSPMAASFYADTRRVRNARIKDELGVTLAYPTYREGLEALARGA